MKFHGLRNEKVLQLAYVFAKSNNIKMPPSWERNEKAGQTFWLNFKTRNFSSHAGKYITDKDDGLTDTMSVNFLTILPQ